MRLWRLTLNEGITAKAKRGLESRFLSRERHGFEFPKNQLEAKELARNVPRETWQKENEKN
jgi:hypothetical protein